MATATKSTAKNTTSANGNGHTAEYGIERSKDLPWHDKKVAIFKALKALKATSAGSAAPATKVAEKAGLTARDVRHYCYHAKAANLVDVAELEDVAGYCFYLTGKGAAIDPTKAQKEERAARDAK